MLVFPVRLISWYPHSVQPQFCLQDISTLWDSCGGELTYWSKIIIHRWTQRSVGHQSKLFCKWWIKASNIFKQRRLKSRLKLRKMPLLSIKISYMMIISSIQMSKSLRVISKMPNKNHLRGKSSEEIQSKTDRRRDPTGHRNLFKDKSLTFDYIIQ